MGVPRAVLMALVAAPAPARHLQHPHHGGGLARAAVPPAAPRHGRDGEGGLAEAGLPGQSVQVQLVPLVDDVVVVLLSQH